MSFIRTKQIPPRTGNYYDYLVKTVHKGNKVIQQHIRYLGRSGTYKMPADVLDNSTGQSIALPDISVPVKESKPARISKMKTPSKHIASALGMYYGGMSLDAIQQQFRQDHELDMSESNYWNWVVRFTKQAIQQCKDFKPEVGDIWVADETYMKLKKRNVYFWDIIDAKTNYLLASHVSFTRGTGDARKLMRLARQRAGKFPKTVVTDKLKSYIAGVGDEYGCYSEHKQGSPFALYDTGESTAEIERFHRTLEQRTDVFQKYKDLASIKLLTQGWLINYNFFKQNEGCGNVPPAQSASKVVPLKDWNDVVIPEGVPEVDYSVKLRRRKSVTKGYPVFDATLIPVEKDSGESA